MKPRRFKPIALFAAFLLIFSLMAGCGNSSGVSPSSGTGTASPSTSESTPTSTTDSGPVNLVVASWLGGKDTQAFNDVFAAYKSDHPNVTVTYQVYPYSGYTDKLTALQSGGQMPDIFLMDQPSGHNSYLYYAGVLQPLDDLIAAANYDTSTWLPGVKESNTVDGHIVAMPIHNQQLVTWYNHDLFAELGIPDLPNNPTWDQIFSTAAQISRIGKDSKGNDIEGMASQALGMLAYLESQGLQLVKSDGSPNFDDPNVISAMATYQQAMIAGGGAGKRIPSNPFASGRQGIVITYMGEVTDNNTPDANGNVASNFDNRVVNLPTNDSSQGNYVVYAPNNFGISTSCKNQSAAFDLLAYLTTDAAVSKLITGANLTPAVNVPSATAFFAPQTDKFPFDFYQITAATPTSTFFSAPDAAWWYSVNNALTTDWIKF
ncbi:MAG: extracellular solute-binding protein, partial [Firmicutes bacterium]|nr:extracellular solute-binding protein [Bacillota bacterium]